MSADRLKGFIQRGAAAQAAVDKIVEKTVEIPKNALTVQRLWGAHPPEWIVALAEACDRSSQGKVGDQLGVSSTQINQALHNNYAGRLDKLEQRVRGELMRATVVCPVLGEISTRKCLDEQLRPFSSTNSLRLQLFRACKTCPNRREP